MQKKLSYDNLSYSHRCFNIKLSIIVEPTCYTKAIINPNWLKIVDLELKSLINTNTWDLVPLPPNKRPIGRKWIFKIKFHINGTIERYKANLVAKF